MLWVFRGEGQWENATWAWGLYKWARPSIVPMLLTDAAELVMMRKSLLGIRRRAEKLAREST